MQKVQQCKQTQIKDFNLLVTQFNNQDDMEKYQTKRSKRISLEYRAKTYKNDINVEFRQHYRNIKQKIESNSKPDRVGVLSMSMDCNPLKYSMNMK